MTQNNLLLWIVLASASNPERQAAFSVEIIKNGAEAWIDGNALRRDIMPSQRATILLYILTGQNAYQAEHHA